MENKNIDILFIPPINNPVFTGDYENYNPLGLLTLCSILEKNNFNGSLFRINQRLIDDNTFIKLSQEIISVRSKIIGFSTYCNSFPAALILAKTIKRLNPESIILFGGPDRKSVV